MTDVERIPAAQVRNTVVGMIGTIAHARKYTWAERPEAAEFLDRMDDLVAELSGHLPENQEDGHG